MDTLTNQEENSMQMETESYDLGKVLRAVVRHSASLSLVAFDLAMIALTGVGSQLIRGRAQGRRLSIEI